MKYFKKFLILGLFALCGVSFCNAEIYLDNFDNYLIATGYVENTRTSSTPYTIYENTEQVDQNLCLKIKNFSGNANNNRALTYGWGTSPNSSTLSVQVFIPYYGLDGNFFCSWGNKQYVNVVLFGNTSFDYELYNLGSFLNSSIVNYTSLQCQTEYNLIPIEDVTKNYCEINFDLIDPIDCPSSPSSGSGEVSRSALYVNNVQYNGAPNLYVNINDLLDYSMTYVSGSAVIDVDGYKADTGYMSDILTIQEYHPSSEDFTVAFVSFLTYVLPYVILALFVVFIWKLIKKNF